MTSAPVRDPLGGHLLVTGPGSRGQPANHLDQATAAHPPGYKTAKAISASNEADAESK